MGISSYQVDLHVSTLHEPTPVTVKWTPSPEQVADGIPDQTLTVSREQSWRDALESVMKEVFDTEGVILRTEEHLRGHSHIVEQVFYMIDGSYYRITDDTTN